MYDISDKLHQTLRLKCKRHFLISPISESCLVTASRVYPLQVASQVLDDVRIHKIVVSYVPAFGEFIHTAVVEAGIDRRETAKPVP